MSQFGDFSSVQESSGAGGPGIGNGGGRGSSGGSASHAGGDGGAAAAAVAEDAEDLLEDSAAVDAYAGQVKASKRSVPAATPPPTFYDGLALWGPPVANVGATGKALRLSQANISAEAPLDSLENVASAIDTDADALIDRIQKAAKHRSVTLGSATNSVVSKAVLFGNLFEQHIFFATGLICKNSLLFDDEEAAALGIGAPPKLKAVRLLLYNYLASNEDSEARQIRALYAEKRLYVQTSFANVNISFFSDTLPFTIGAEAGSDEERGGGGGGEDGASGSAKSTSSFSKRLTSTLFFGRKELQLFFKAGCFSASGGGDGGSSSAHSSPRYAALAVLAAAAKGRGESDGRKPLHSAFLDAVLQDAEGSGLVNPLECALSSILLMYKEGAACYETIGVSVPTRDYAPSPALLINPSARPAPAAAAGGGSGSSSGSAAAAAVMRPHPPGPWLSAVLFHARALQIYECGSASAAPDFDRKFVPALQRLKEKVVNWLAVAPFTATSRLYSLKGVFESDKPEDWGLSVLNDTDMRAVTAALYPPVQSAKRARRIEAAPVGREGGGAEAASEGGAAPESALTSGS